MLYLLILLRSFSLSSPQSYRIICRCIQWKQQRINKKNPLQKTLQKLPKNSCSSQSSQGSTSLSWSLHQQPSPQHFGVMVGSDPNGVVVAGGQEWCPICGQLPSGSRAQWFSANCRCVKLIFSLDGNPVGNFLNRKAVKSLFTHLGNVFFSWAKNHGC